MLFISFLLHAFRVENMLAEHLGAYRRNRVGCLLRLLLKVVRPFAYAALASQKVASSRESAHQHGMATEEEMSGVGLVSCFL